MNINTAETLYKMALNSRDMKKTLSDFIQHVDEKALVCAKKGDMSFVEKRAYDLAWDNRDWVREYFSQSGYEMELRLCSSLGGYYNLTCSWENVEPEPTVKTDENKTDVLESFSIIKKMFNDWMGLVESEAIRRWFEDYLINVHLFMDFRVYYIEGSNRTDVHINFYTNDNGVAGNKISKIFLTDPNDKTKHIDYHKPLSVSVVKIIDFLNWLDEIGEKL